MKFDLDLGGPHALSRHTTMGERYVGRHYTRDALTFDSGHFQVDNKGNMQGKPLGGRFNTHDGKTVDSTGAFLVGELERLDQKFHGPLDAASPPAGELCFNI